MAAALDRKYIIVAAIDFGTTFSGYAFSFKATKDDPKLHESIRLNTDWGASLGCQSYKTPTSVLMDKSGRFIAFGYEAEQQYQDALQHGGDLGDMLLFRHFKMMLYNKQNVKKNAKIVSVDGTIGPALNAFAEAIKYLKNHLLETLAREFANAPDCDRIRWVITVPAIWSDESKQFMREAGFMAGCTKHKDSDQLVIALEPEAASLCCRRLGVAQYSDVTGITFIKGTKYLVLDCGGGTVDIAAHIIESDNQVCELSCVSGGQWGGTQVDQNLIQLLVRIFGANFVNTYKKQAPTEWLGVMTTFEKLKKAFKPDGKSRISLPIPWNMQKIYRKLNDGKEIDDRIGEMSRDLGVTFIQGQMVIKHDEAMKLFDPVVRSVIAHIKTLLTDPALSGLNYIFMVGGFSECNVLQQAMKSNFPRNGLKILTPSSAQLAILKGAVLFGHQPTEIKRRMAKYTYGSAVSAPFDARIHDPMYKVVDSRGVLRCEDILKVYVEKGEQIPVGSKRHFTINAPSNSVQETLSLLCLDGKPSKPVQYINVPGIRQVGEITLRTPPSLNNRQIKVELDLGGTEMRVQAQFSATGEQVSTVVDFLTH